MGAKERNLNSREAEKVAAARLDWYRAISIPAKQLTLAHLQEGGIMPAIDGTGINANGIQEENTNRIDWFPISGSAFIELTIWFSPKAKLQLVFDVERSFDWLTLLARSGKVGLHVTKQPGKTVVVTIDTENLRLWLLHYYLSKAPKCDFTDEALCRLLLLVKALGLPFDTELDATVPDLVIEMVRELKRLLSSYEKA